MLLQLFVSESLYLSIVLYPTSSPPSPLPSYLPTYDGVYPTSSLPSQCHVIHVSKMDWSSALVTDAMPSLFGQREENITKVKEVPELHIESGTSNHYKNIVKGMKSYS